MEFPGTDLEQFALVNAVKSNCGCKVDRGITVEQAGCHQLLMPDIEKWSRLIFVRRIAERLLAEEFTDGREDGIGDSPIVPYPNLAQ